MPEPSWEPVLHGGVYCSPACGNGCTVAEYESAKAEAAALTAELGPGFQSRVWENLGWHCESKTHCGRIRVHCDDGGYYASLNRDGGLGGEFTAKGDTPKEAVANVLAEARSYVAGFGWLDTISELGVA